MDARGRGIEKLATISGLKRSTPWRALRQTRPTISTCERLAEALGVRPAWLAFGDGEMDAKCES
jgi:DNA-binding phage protein